MIHYHNLLSDPTCGPMAASAIQGDKIAILAVLDWLEEQGVDMNTQTPFEVGKCYFICTQTLYYVGRVRAVDLGWVYLEDSSWVHWTGQLSVLLKEQSFKSNKFGSRLPRTEFCGDTTVSQNAIVSLYPWTGKLPMESIQQ